jgi:hypothetical protein
MKLLLAVLLMAATVSARAEEKLFAKVIPLVPPA